MFWALSLCRGSYSALSTPSCPHSFPAGSPLRLLEDTVMSPWLPPTPREESPSALRFAGPALLDSETQRERTRALTGRARGRKLPVAPCSSGSPRVSANGGRSQPPWEGLSLPSHGASAHSGRFQATAICRPRKGTEAKCLASGRGSMVLTWSSCLPLEATEVQADSPVRAAVVNTLQKREVPVVTWGMRPPMRSRGRG